MDSNGKKSKSNSKGGLRRKVGWGLFSCFNGRLRLSDEETKKRSWGKRQIVVPLENGTSGTEISTNGDASGMKERNEGSNRQKSSKDKCKKTTSSTRPQQQLPTQEPSERHVASKLRTRSEPTPLYRMLDPVRTRTRTRTSHHGSPEPGPRTRMHDPSMGLCVITVALAMMILCGFTFAVICMCVWFCLLYMLRNDVQSVPDGTGQKGLEKIDVNSEEYKKMVVLRGFLNREKRKTLADRIRDGGL